MPELIALFTGFVIFIVIFIAIPVAVLRLLWRMGSNRKKPHRAAERKTDEGSW